MTENEMVGWHHQLNGLESEEASGAGDGQGSLVCYSPWGCKQLNTTERLNWTEAGEANRQAMTPSWDNTTGLVGFHQVMMQ